MKMTYDPIKELKILHVGLCLGASLIILINHFVVEPINLDGMMGSLNVISIVGLVFGGLLVLLANFIFNKKSLELGADINSENLNEYKAAYLLKWSLLEAAIFLNALFYFFMEADPLNILVSMLLVLVLYFSKPLIA